VDGSQPQTLEKVFYPSPPYVAVLGTKLKPENKSDRHPENLSFNTFSILGDLS
jgi:hypothetical protein